MPFPVETRTSWVNVLGYAASVAVLATFFMSTMIPLRIVALARNLPFCAYGYLDHLYPVLFLHAALFPVNLWRPTQFQRLVRDVRRSHRKDLSLKHLLPYMKKRSCATGETLVRKGEKADRLYYLAKGALEIVEIGKVLKPGAFFGEIGVFARNQERTATIECRTDCRLPTCGDSIVDSYFYVGPSTGGDVDGGTPSAGGGDHCRSAFMMPLRRAISRGQYFGPRDGAPTAQPW